MPWTARDQHHVVVAQPGVPDHGVAAGAVRRGSSGRRSPIPEAVRVVDYR